MEFTGKKKFKVSTRTFESIEIYAVFEIYFDFPKVKERIIEMSQFWSRSPDVSEPLEEHLAYVLTIATSKIYHEQDRNWKLSDVESMDNYLWTYEDGFAYGEYVGIKLIDFHADEICSDIFEVEEMEE
ncbi:hypothetical protein [Pasteurella multocida]|uniref:hypothetical protein n=1 Tax=Pasteurella multocida TaxID=747 RepID=UPI0013F422A1|nr:hypothetical protein [Pasteurella multocida]